MPPEMHRGFVCPHCDKLSDGTVKGVAIWDGRDHLGEPINPPVEYVLLACGRCGDISVQIREDYGEGFEFDEAAFVYPSTRQLSGSVPEPLRREWQEALTCFRAKAYAASLVMVRRTLEGTCVDLGVEGKTLAARLDKLRTEGLIDGLLSDWANALRIAGNKGAHYTGKQVHRQDAEDAIDFAEAFLDHIYVLRKKFGDFQQRLERRGRPPARRTRAEQIGAAVPK